VFTARYGLIPYMKQIAFSVLYGSQDSDFALYIINRLVFITVFESVYSAVRADSLHKADCVECFVQITEQTATLLYTSLTDWFL
jgi:hypothetical protein